MENYFFSTLRPHRLYSPIGCHLILVAGTWIRLNVNFVAAGLIGVVCDPAAVGREHGRGFVETRTGDRRVFSIGNRYSPDVVTRLRVGCMESDSRAIW